MNKPSPLPDLNRYFTHRMTIFPFQIVVKMFYPASPSEVTMHDYLHHQVASTQIRTLLMTSTGKISIIGKLAETVFFRLIALLQDARISDEIHWSSTKTSLFESLENSIVTHQYSSLHSHSRSDDEKDFERIRLKTNAPVDDVSLNDTH